MTCVMEQMGHSSIKVTVDVYGKWAHGGTNQDAADRLASLLEGRASLNNLSGQGCERFGRVRLDGRVKPFAALIPVPVVARSVAGEAVS